MIFLAQSISSQGGWTLVIIGTLVVFIALFLLVLIFNFIPVLLKKNIRFRMRKAGKLEEIKSKNILIEADHTAAISMALYLYFAEDHDVESNIVTIKRLSRRYSPWNSKIYNVIDRL